MTTLKPAHIACTAALLVWLALSASAALPSLPGSPLSAIDGASNTTEGANAASPSDASAKPESPESRLSALHAQIAELDDKITRATEAATNDTATQLGVSIETLNDRVTTLQDTKYFLERIIGAIQDLSNTENQKKALGQQKADFKGFDEKPPYSVNFVDDLSGTVAAKQLDLEAAQEDLAFIKEQRDRMAKALDDARTALATKKEAVGSTPSPGDLWNITYLQERVKRLEAAEGYFKARIEAQNALIAYLSDEVEWQQQKLAMARKQLAFTEADLKEKLDALTKHRDDLNDSVDKAQSNYEKLARKAADAQQTYERTRSSGASDDELRPLAASMNSQQEIAQNALARYEILRDLRDSYDREQRLWELRFRVLNPSDNAPIDELIGKLAAPTQLLGKLRENATRKLLAVQTTSANLTQQLNQSDVDDAQRARWQAQLDSNKSLEDALTQWISRLLELQQLTARINEEAGARKAAGSLADQWQNILTTAQAVWNYKITSVEDNPLTVRKLVIAILIFCIGLILSRLLVRWLRGRVFKRMRLEESVAAAISKGVYYFLLLFVGYYALKVVSIPLTVFTFFGGALAIGVGFGAQNLINNFISGVILMIERPIKINDIVDVDGQWGRIVSIGARCSQLRTFGGVDIIIPNSSFLEKNVVNWTLSDAQIRFSVSVGVAYGSPTRDVSKLIMKAVEEHGRILKDPPPVVLFTEFGDSTLNFETYFWVSVGADTDARMVQSDVRHRIDKLFKEAGIVIAFPQRDIHIDTSRPLDVRVVASEPQKEEAEPGEGG